MKGNAQRRISVAMGHFFPSRFEMIQVVYGMRSHEPLNRRGIVKAARERMYFAGWEGFFSSYFQDLIQGKEAPDERFQNAAQIVDRLWPELRSDSQ